MNRQSQLQNKLLSKRNQQRAFLQRKIAQHEYTPARDIEGRARNRRMAENYRAELARLEARG